MEKLYWSRWKPGGHPTLFAAVSVDDRPEAKSEIHVLCWWSICLQNPGNLSAMDWLKGKSNLWLYPHYRGLIMDYGGVPCKISINLAARPKWSMIQVPPFLAQRFQVLSRWTRAFPEWPLSSKIRLWLVSWMKFFSLNARIPWGDCQEDWKEYMFN